MTPEQEKKLDGVLAKLDVTLARFEAGVQAVHNVQSAQLALGQRMTRLESSWAKSKEWLRTLIKDWKDRNRSIPPPRAEMPSMSADDSGSIEIAGPFGARAAFTGDGPVSFAKRLLLAFVLLFAAAGAGYEIHAANGAQQQQQITKEK